MGKFIFKQCINFLCFYGVFFYINNAQSIDKKLSYSNIIQKVAPAVVSVHGYNAPNKTSSQGNSNVVLYNQLSGKKGSSSAHSVGSGVIVNEEGFIITNAHVVDQRNIITVILNNGKKYQATKLSVNTAIDLALLKIVNPNNEKFNYLDVKDEKDRTEIGDVVLAIGNPFGIGQTVTSGIVSGFRYFEKGEEVGFGKLIQLDAAINPGNSGGALINSLGDLIGINSTIYTYNNNTASGIGFAIPASVVQLFITRYYSGGSLKKYWIGLTGLTVNSDIALQLRLKYPAGVYVNHVAPGAPADVATIKKGDIIIKIDDVKVNTMSDLAFTVAKIDSNTPILVTLLRKNQEVVVRLTPELPQETPKKELYEISHGVLKGTVFANNSPAVSYEVNSDVTRKGVVIYKLPSNSLLKKLGIEVGDAISTIGDMEVNTTKDIQKYIEMHSNSSSYQLTITRRNQDISLNINK